MSAACELLRNGPYLRVTLPDVLPPDWAALLRDLRREASEGVERVTVLAPAIDLAGDDGERVLGLAATLVADGICVSLEREEDLSFVAAF